MAVGFTEQQIYPFLQMEHLRADLFDLARRLIRSNAPTHPWATMDDEELLQDAGFVRTDLRTGESGCTLAAALVFGRDEIIQSVAPGYKFDALLRRRDVDRFDDRLTVRTNLIEAYDQLMGFVAKHLSDPFYLEGDRRVSLRDMIFREAISNIIAHREYTSPAAATLCIYADRVELRNPHTANVRGEITPDNVVPFPKNPTICRFLIQLGRFDELGSGVVNLHRYLPKYSDGAKPKFEAGDHFLTILPLPKTPPVTKPSPPVPSTNAPPVKSAQTPPVAGKDTPPVEPSPNQSSTETTPPVAPPVDVTESMWSLLILLGRRGELGAGAIRAALSLKDRTHVREAYVNPCLDAELIERTIPDKPNSRLQQYRLTPKGRNSLNHNP